MDTQTQTPEQAYATRVIDAFDGTAELARLCKISMAAVSQWKENGIPGYRIDFLRLARPDVFARLDAEDQAAADPASVNRRHDDSKALTS
jgi:hypothetical protein